MAGLGFRTDAALTAQAREAPGGIPALVGSWIEANGLDPFVKIAVDGPDVAADFAALLEQACIVIEQSPPELASLSGLLKKGGGVALNFGHPTAWWILITMTVIPLLVGSNQVIIRTTDTLGNMSWKSVVVARR